MSKVKQSKSKSAKKVRLGKKLARQLPRDRSGKFLPKGSKNLFKKKKTVTKRKQPSRKPMAKRRKTTSKIRSVNEFPQYIDGKVIFPPALLPQTSFTTLTFTTPIPRLQSTGNRATVMELLWLDTDSQMIMTFPFDIYSWVFYTGPPIVTFAEFENLKLDNTRVIATNTKFGNGSEVIVSTSTMDIENSHFRWDFEDNQGFGYLFASDKFNVALGQDGLGLHPIFTFRLWYRFVEIPLSEFIGLVQTQQQF